jgi:hypothetical protein
LISRPLRTLFSRSSHPAQAPHDTTRRRLLLLSLANWAIAITAWTISAYLGIASPARIFVYTVLFVIGLFAVLVAIGSYLLERFAHRPELAPARAVEEPAGPDA